MLSGNQESPAAPADQYDTLATLPAETNKLDAMDLLIRKIGQMRDLCNTCSSTGDEAIHGVFWFMADALQCCEQLADKAFKATAAAEHDMPTTTPDQAAPVAAPTTETPVHNSPLADAVVMPRADHDKLGLALETLRAQLLIASDPEVYQTNTERTLSAFVYGMQCETDRAIDLVSGCKTLHTFKHRHGPDMEQTP